MNLIFIRGIFNNLINHYRAQMYADEGVTQSESFGNIKMVKMVTKKNIILLWKL